MKLDTLFEKFLSLFKKEESEIEKTEMNGIEQEESVSSNYGVQEQGERKRGQLALFENFGVAII